MLIEGAGTVWELIRTRAAASPNRQMLLSDLHPPLTFAQFAERAETVAARLTAAGIRPGSTVVWQQATSPDAIVFWAALARLGARQVPLIPHFHQREIDFVVAQIQPSLTLRAGDPLPSYRRAPLPPPPAEDGERWVYYTSGTTADPKGVRHTDGSLIAGGEAMADALGMSEHDVGSIAFPFAHIAGPDYVIAMLVVGFPAVVLPSFHAPAAVETFNRHRVTMAGGSTAFYQAFLEVQRSQRDTPLLPWVRLFSGGGAPMPPALWHEVRDEIGVRTLHGYAMTEAPMAVMGRWEHTDDELATTAGTPVRGVEMRVVNGEIQLRGKTMFRGYTDPELDRDCWDGDWFRTGDLGEIRDGHLTVTGRIKDVIIRKGENISALEVENLIATHPDVQAVAVIGLPDDVRGELVCACVELRPTKTLTLDELAEHLASLNVMPQKIPERLEITRLPRGGTLQKILKNELRARYV